MGRFWMGVALALALSSPVRAGVEVTTAGGLVNVTASQASISEVLDGLARKTRMKVVYEGLAPGTPVTVELRNRTPAQAVLGVLEGLGLNYALVLDPSGTEVETLMIVGSGTSTGTTSAGTSARTTSAGSARPPRNARREAPRADAEEAVVETEEPPPEVAPEASVPAPAEAVKVDENPKSAPNRGPMNPTGSFPVSPFAPGPPPPVATPSPSPNPPSSP